MRRQVEGGEGVSAGGSAIVPIQPFRTSASGSRVVQTFALTLVMWTSLFSVQKLFLSSSGRLPVSRSTSQPHGTTPDDTFFPWTSITPRSDTITWHHCYELYDCARVSLPLDYLDTTKPRRVTIPLIRLPVSSSTINETYPHPGPVFFNPGGPGGSGIYAMLNRGHLLQSIIGTNHDLISFDPRGVGLAEPKINCWGSEFANRMWELEGGEVADANTGGIYNAFVRAKAHSRKCATAPDMLMGEEANATPDYHPLLSHVSTTDVARDLAAILDLMGEPKLKYWGFSYGTYLGGVFASLFPDRVERMVNDGNINYAEWSTNNHTTFSTDADKIMTKFYHYCAKNNMSALHLQGQTPGEVEERIDNILEKLQTEPIISETEVFVQGVPTIATYSMVRRLIASALYQPRKMFPQLAEILFSLEQLDAGPLLNYYATFTAPLGCREEHTVSGKSLFDLQAPYPGILEANFEASAAVMCSDGGSLNDSLSHALNHTAHLLHMSKAAGPVNAINWLDCSGWKIEARERFAGPFGGKTKGPILFVGNEWDNVTPGRNARLNAEGFEGAGVVVLNGGLGHTSLSTPSKQLSEMIYEYFQAGKMPEGDAFADDDEFS